MLAHDALAQDERTLRTHNREQTDTDTGATEPGAAGGLGGNNRKHGETAFLSGEGRSGKYPPPRPDAAIVAMQHQKVELNFVNHL
ncbi:hypothetical protein D3C81_1721260 [compost metagenome]